MTEGAIKRVFLQTEEPITEEEMKTAARLVYEANSRLYDHEFVDMWRQIGSNYDLSLWADYGMSFRVIVHPVREGKTITTEAVYTYPEDAGE